MDVLNECGRARLNVDFCLKFRSHKNSVTDGFRLAADNFNLVADEQWSQLFDSFFMQI